MGSVTAQAAGGSHVDVRILSDGPWTAFPVGFDLSKIKQITYYIRDARGHWRKVPVVTSPPFEAAISWWDGNNAGYEAVTAHVITTAGKEIKDPGGYHWVNGQHANPGGQITAVVNPDGTGGATYDPEKDTSVIKGVEFWFRDANSRWLDGGAGAQSGDDGGWVVDVLNGTSKPGWNGSGAAVAVHVIWPNESQWTDPAPYARTFSVPAPAITTVAAKSIPAVSGTITCGDPTAHVYNPARLHLLAACVTVTGTVEFIRVENDGDLHILLRLDAGEEKYVNAKNVSLEHGDLVLEPVCTHGVTQTDAIAACAGYVNPLPIPAVGSHVAATGPWVLDADHGWLEIHPVASFNAVGAPPPPSTPTPTARPTAAPTTVPPPPPPAAVTVAFLNAPLTVPHGQKANLQVRTAPNTGCSIVVVYKSGPSTAAGLGSATSDGAGNVGWTWIVGTRTTLGSWPITVTCAGVSAQTTITVT